jgi:hypothetical protein
MVFSIGGLVFAGFFLAEIALAQPPSAPPRPAGGDGRGGPRDRGGFDRGGFGGVVFGEPSLSFELRRNEELAAKIGLTDEQKKALSDIDMDRMTFFRSMPRGASGPGSEEFEKRMNDMQVKLKEFEVKCRDILTPDQKVIWEARVVEVKQEQAAREAARREAARVPADATSPQLPSDRERIRVLEEEVKTLKEEIAKLKAASGAAKPTAP